MYYDYQLSKERWSFGDGVLDLKLQCCHGQLSLFPMVTISLPAISLALLSMTSKAEKLPLEMEPVACDNNTSLMLKPGHLTFFAPFSTDNYCSLIGLNLLTVSAPAR